VIRTSNESALDTGFAQGFLETTRAYLAEGSTPTAHATRETSEPGATPLPVIERGYGPRPMLHVLGPDSI
jgi:hypothetical protein